MADRTLAEMTESELRQLIAEQATSRPLRIKYKLGEMEFEVEGNVDDVKNNLRKFLAALPALQKSQRVTEYDFEKDKTVAVMPGPSDSGERAEEILAEEVTEYGWTLKRDDK